MRHVTKEELFCNFCTKLSYLLMVYGPNFKFIVLDVFSLMQQLGQELEQDETRSYRPQVGSPIANSPPGMLLPHELFPTWLLLFCISVLKPIDDVFFPLLFVAY